MDKFYLKLFTALSYFFLAVSILDFSAFLLTDGKEKNETWPIFIGIVLGGLMCAGMCWVLRSVLIYTTRENKETGNEYQSNNE